MNNIQIIYVRILKTQVEKNLTKQKLNKKYLIKNMIWIKYFQKKINNLKIQKNHKILFQNILQKDLLILKKIRKLKL